MTSELRSVKDTHFFSHTCISFTQKVNVKFGTGERPSRFPCQISHLSWQKCGIMAVMNTTPLSALVSFLSLKQHLYADDTQLFLSFHPSNFHSNISHLQNALQHISSRMTASLLTLKSSKTEFLLIGLKQQLSKI